jgi:hypothetical protein
LMTGSKSPGKRQRTWWGKLKSEVNTDKDKINPPKNERV